MSNFTRFFTFVVVTLLCCLFAMGCDDILKDPNFHTWCGDQLCSWKLESGQIRRAPTWHPKDYGVEMLDSDDATHVTTISQVVTKTPPCLEFTTVADVAPEAQVSVAVDFNGDGTVEWEQPIAATGFSEQKTQVTAPPFYTSIKFTITKKGTGRAVLAQMDVRSKDGCTAAPVALKRQALGTSCSLLGRGEECISGICCSGTCSECCSFGSCPNAEVCGTIPGLGLIPRQCNAGKPTREKGSECLLDGDCVSDDCAGAVFELVNVKIDGGACPPPPALLDGCFVKSVHAGTCR